MAFRGDGDRSFIGELTDPLPARSDENGRIVVDGASARGHGHRQSHGKAV